VWRTQDNALEIADPRCYYQLPQQEAEASNASSFSQRTPRVSWFTAPAQPRCEVGALEGPEYRKPVRSQRAQLALS
jgi:hypothetical protein